MRTRRVRAKRHFGYRLRISDVATEKSNMGGGFCKKP